MEPIGRGRYGGTYLSTWYVYLEVSDEYYHLVLYLFLNTVARLLLINMTTLCNIFMYNDIYYCENKVISILGSL